MTVNGEQSGGSDFSPSVDQVVGSRIRILREKCYAGSGEVARAVDIPPDLYNHFESGTSRVSPDALVRIARLFDVPVHFFFVPGAVENTDSIISAHRDQTTISELSDLIPQLTLIERLACLALVKELISGRNDQRVE